MHRQELYDIRFRCERVAVMAEEVAATTPRRSGESKLAWCERIVTASLERANDTLQRLHADKQSFRASTAWYRARQLGPTRKALPVPKAKPSPRPKVKAFAGTLHDNVQVDALHRPLGVRTARNRSSRTFSTR